MQLRGVNNTTEIGYKSTLVFTFVFRNCQVFFANYTFDTHCVVIISREGERIINLVSQYYTAFLLTNTRLSY